MDLNSKEIQLQYEGFLNTPFLWKSDAVFGLKQLNCLKEKTAKFEGEIPKKLRLGKRVERFVSFELNQQKSITILAENIQIQDEKITVGEIDCILKQQEKPIHLEIVYKFYLYDETFGNTELEHWIGPNRNDNLVKKLTKLKDKQLPLLFNNFTKPLLQNLNIEASKIQQQVYFKAQLFVPYKTEITSHQLINTNCIEGFYIRFNELSQFSTSKFYIPTKINWLQKVQSHTNWISFDVFFSKVALLLQNKISPLCWIKNPNGTTQKFFIVWWE